MKSKYLIVFLLILFEATNLYSITDSLEACYSFQGNANDAISNSNHGTVYGATITTDRLGNNNSAYNFDGVNDQINLPQAFDYANRTVSMWFQANSINSAIGILYESDNNNLLHGQTQLGVQETGGNDSLVFLVGAAANLRKAAITEGQWHHLAVTVSNTIIVYYLDGNVVDTVYDLSNSHSTTGNLFATVGAHRSNGYHFEGKIDDLKIYNRALSKVEIGDLSNIYLNGCSLVCESIAHYKFEGNAYDSTSNSNHGTVYGATLTTDRFGNSNLAYAFDGLNDQINLPQAFDYANRTVSMWFQANSVNSAIGILYESDNNNLLHGQTQLGVQETGGNDSLVFLVGAAANLRKAAITEGQWHHLAVTVSNTIIVYYLDGDIVDTVYDLSNSHSTSGNLYATVGAHRSNGYHFDGKIDDIKIFDCALDSAGVNAERGMLPVGIVDYQNPLNISIYPNPTSGVVNINFADFDKRNISIFNSLGQEVYSNMYTSSFVKINMENKELGLYYLKVFSKDKVSTHSLILE